jgi:hypothetical protein
MKTDIQNVHELWAELKTNGNRYKVVWDEISKYVGIGVEPNNIWAHNPARASQQLDQFIDDPTASICVNQAGDYLVGIMWGTGDHAVTVKPSRYVLELASMQEVQEWFDFASEQLLYHVNHAHAGFQGALTPYAYDQMSFGTSGIGCFPNQGFIDRVDDNALQFRQYGVDSTRIEEGKSGVPEIVGAIYRWRCTRIVGQFAMKDGALDAKLFGKLPKRIQDAYNNNDLNQQFDLVCLVYPRTDFAPHLKGKRGARYKGSWFLDEGSGADIFYEEDFQERPIAMARQVKLRNEIYGRASGTMLLSTIRSGNYIVGNVIEILEKMANPALGLFNNALFGDSVLDTSASGLTIFNLAANAGNNPPIFPLHDVGDPSEIIKFLIPYLNEKIATAFKVDALLDFDSAKEMTATESLQRYAIRGKSLSSMLVRQKTELLEPLMRRALSILHNIGELGVDPTQAKGHAAALVQQGKQARVIPKAVLDCIEKGRPWYEFKFNNELEKLTRTEAVQALVQVLQTITAIAAVYQDIIEAVDWYKLLKEINDNLDDNNQILLDEKAFKAKIAAVAQQRAAAMQAQAAEQGSGALLNAARANKTTKEASNVQQPTGGNTAGAIPQ